MKPGLLTFDTLVDAYFDAAEYARSAPELRDYHTQKREILEALFGCSLEDPATIPAYRRMEDRDALAMRDVARVCLERGARLGWPFHVYLEGGPGPVEESLWKKHAPALNQALGSLKASYRAIFRDALGASFRDAPSKMLPAELLHEHGLPATRPDPDDFW